MTAQLPSAWAIYQRARLKKTKRKNPEDYLTTTDTITLFSGAGAAVVQMQK